METTGKKIILITGPKSMNYRYHTVEEITLKVKELDGKMVL